MIDTVLRNATIHDGTGRSSVVGDLGIDGGRIVSVAEPVAEDAARPEDHEFWVSVPGLHAYTVMRDGHAAGYAYVQVDGSIGPIAVLDPVDLAPVVEASIGRAAELGAPRARVRIPGVARPAVAGLLARGWRFGDAVTLVLSSAPWGHWDRYVTSGGDALL